jgi:UPF0716 family protein affecting phage T7 exclusion
MSAMFPLRVPLTPPVLVLAAALAGIVWFSRGLGIGDTVGLLVCGVVAGASIAAVVTGRRRTR